MEVVFTPSKLRTLGRHLRDTERPTEEDLLLLQLYRMSFREIIKRVFEIVCVEAYKINVEAICSFRIKRIDSIIRKLQRLKGQLELKSMRDIAGCRCILQSDTEVFKLMKALKRSPLRLAQDPNIYIGKKKKESGYQSIHLYVALPEYPQQCVEIQIRSTTHHDWATFVETLDLLYDTKIKEGIQNNSQQYKDFYRFHQILSIPESKWNQNEGEAILKTVIEYDIIGKLDSVLVKNVVHVRHQWAEMLSNNLSPSYFFISTNEENQPTIVAFELYSQAEAFYYESFESNPNTNMVLVCMPNATFEMISIAYANYLLVSHKFTHQLHVLFAKYIDNYFNYNPSLAHQFFNYYQRSADKILDYIDVEINDMKRSSNQYDDAIMNEWMSDVKDRLQSYHDDLNTINRKTYNKIVLGNVSGVKRIYMIFIFFIQKLIN